MSKIGFSWVYNVRIFVIGFDWKFSSKSAFFEIFVWPGLASHFKLLLPENDIEVKIFSVTEDGYTQAMTENFWTNPGNGRINHENEVQSKITKNERFENDYGSGFGLLWLVYFLTGNSVVIFAKMSDKRPLPRWWRTTGFSVKKSSKINPKSLLQRYYKDFKNRYFERIWIK